MQGTEKTFLTDDYTLKIALKEGNISILVKYIDGAYEITIPLKEENIPIRNSHMRLNSKLLSRLLNELEKKKCKVVKIENNEKVEVSFFGLGFCFIGINSSQGENLLSLDHSLEVKREIDEVVFVESSDSGITSNVITESGTALISTNNVQTVIVQATAKESSNDPTSVMKDLVSTQNSIIFYTSESTIHKLKVFEHKGKTLLACGTDKGFIDLFEIGESDTKLQSLSGQRHESAVTWLEKSLYRYGNDEFSFYLISCGLDQYIRVWEVNIDKNMFQLYKNFEVKVSPKLSVFCQSPLEPSIYYANNPDLKIMKLNLSSDEVKIDKVSFGSHSNTVYGMTTIKVKGKVCLAYCGAFKGKVDHETLHQILVYDLESYEMVAELGDHDQNIWSLIAVDSKSESQYLVSSSSDKSVRVWNVETGQKLEHVVSFGYGVSLSSFVTKKGIYVACGFNYRSDSKIKKGHTVLYKLKDSKLEYVERYECLNQGGLSSVTTLASPKGKALMFYGGGDCKINHALLNLR